MLPFTVHLKHGEPAHAQILAAVREAFAVGQLRDGDPFPSTRSITQELRVSPSVAQKVVDQLIDDGFLTQRRGSGFIIRTGAPARWVSELKASQDRTVVADTLSEARQAGSPDTRFSFLAPPDPDPDRDNAGAMGLIEHYEVMRLIARGGMGMVFEALDLRLKRKVAVKVLIPQLAASPESRTRFLREARAAAGIDHGNVLPIHAVGEFNGFPYLVMPLVSGESLQDRLRRDGPLPLDDLRRIALGVAHGLAAAHQKGVVHRDIKPDNVLLETGHGCRVWLADFGLARALHDGELTAPGVIAGTPQFTSPEQARGLEVDFRADLFSFGSLLYAMATGSSPFEGENPLAVLRRIIDEEPTPPREKRPDLPPEVQDLILDLLQKNPEDRPAGASEVIDRLASSPLGRFA